MRKSLPQQIKARLYCARQPHPALFMEMRLGKTKVVLNHYRHLKCCLVIAPLAALISWAEEATLEGMPEPILLVGSRAKRLQLLERSPGYLHPGWYCLNYEGLLVVPEVLQLPWDLVVLDECFVPGTQISSPKGFVPIETLRHGDRVYTGEGVGTVNFLMTRRVKRLCRVKTSRGTFLCSENHPFWTREKGWLPSHELARGQTLQTLRPGLFVYTNKGNLEARVLQQPVCNSLAYERSNVQSQDISEPNSIAKVVTSVAQTLGCTITRGSFQTQPCRGYGGAQQSCCPSENLGKFEGDRPSAAMARRKRQTFTDSAEKSLEGTREELGCGIRGQFRQTDSRVPDALQDRHCMSSPEVGNRSKRSQSSQNTNGNRSQEAMQVGIAWVESVEVLEPGDPSVAGYRSTDGSFELWDIEIQGSSPTFFVNDVLVHNSARIRNPRTKGAKLCLAGFREATHRCIMTGLPNPESLLDYVPQILFLDGGFLGAQNYWQFRQRYFRVTAPHEWQPRPGARTKILTAVRKRAFVMSRQEAGLGNRKIRERRIVPLSAKARYIYQKAEREFALQTDEGERWTRWRVVAHTWLAQIAGGFVRGALIDAAKLEEARSLLVGELAGDSVVVWFRFNDELMALGSLLKRAGVSFASIKGSVSFAKRRELCKAFQQGKIRVLLLQIKCARYSLDLSRSSTAVYYSNDYSCENRAQSEDRIVNPMKREPLLFIDLVRQDTVDEDVVRVLRRKHVTSRQLFQKLDAFMKARHSGSSPSIRV